MTSNSRLFYGSCVSMGVASGIVGGAVGTPVWGTMLVSFVGAVAIIVLFAVKGWDLDG